mmetsp:Transcript_9552/g.19428  ORF Transcript_9552/g.19428 Transcript_9552/m.19428 type:complete len:654 (+) Transcript_9552:122-2083(+)
MMTSLQGPRFYLLLFLLAQQLFQLANAQDEEEEGCLTEEEYAAIGCSKIGSIRRGCQCQFSSHCDDHNGLQSLGSLLTYCTSGLFPTFLSLLLLSIYSIIIFTVLGSTAEDFFSPSLEQFSVSFSLPPRFAGVTLLALGNGAADVSATVSSLLSNKEGYQMALGALTGAGMFVSCVVASMVLVKAEGVRCKGALIRDIAALAVCCAIVMIVGGGGSISGSGTTIFLVVYALFVCIVLAADVYHRKVTLPRLREQARLGLGGGGGSNDDLKENAGAVERIMTAMSNYDWNTQVEGWMTEDGESGGVVLKGGGRKRGKKKMNREEGNGGEEEAGVDYSLMESFEIEEPGAGTGGLGGEENNGRTARTVLEGLRGCKEQIIESAKEHIEENYKDPEVKLYAKAFSALQLPFDILRNLTICLTSPEEYNRGLLFISCLCSPLWIAFYASFEHETNLFSSPSFWVFSLITTTFSILVTIYAPVPTHNCPKVTPPNWIAVPLALYGFVIAATWIDFIADQLVEVLQYFGTIAHIPNAMLGLTILAWGNSIGDLSTNMSMAKRGLANMSITACFAGPVFNILVGLGVGFNLSRKQQGLDVIEIELTPSIWVGLLFLIVNCVAMLVTGLVFQDGFVPAKYGYVGLAIYTAYLVACISLEFG